jgi:hypothetical protein
MAKAHPDAITPKAPDLSKAKSGTEQIFSQLDAKISKPIINLLFPT